MVTIRSQHRFIFRKIHTRIAKSIAAHARAISIIFLLGVILSYLSILGLLSYKYGEGEISWWKRDAVVLLKKKLPRLETDSNEVARFLLYSTRNDGFNNQLDQVRLAICSAYKSSRTLVLLPFWYDWSWDEQNLTAFKDFGEYFDVQKLSKLVPVMNLRDYQKQRSGEGESDIDIQCNPGGVKEKILNITTFSVANTCETSILNSSIPAVSAAQSLSDMCGTYGVGNALRRGNMVKPETMHYLVSTHLTFSTQIERYASQIIQDIKTNNFIAIHVRLGDYRQRHCKHLTLCPTVAEILDCINHFDTFSVFLATNPSELPELKQNISSSKMKIFDASKSDIPRHLRSAVEQAVCTHSSVFIGSNISSWSQLVFDIRDNSHHKKKSFTWNQCVEL